MRICNMDTMSHHSGKDCIITQNYTNSSASTPVGSMAKPEKKCFLAGGRGIAHVKQDKIINKIKLNTCRKRR